MFTRKEILREISESITKHRIYRRPQRGKFWEWGRGSRKPPETQKNRRNGTVQI